MNYYSSDYQMNTDPLVKRMLTTADEIVTLYMAGDSSSRVESLRRTQVYIEQFEEYVTGQHDGSRGFYCDTKALKEALARQLSIDVTPILIEIELAVSRVRNFVSGESIADFGIDHNARFVDWTLRLLGISAKSAFSDLNREYLSSTERFFSGDEERNYSGRKMLFYRNAYRAEMYSHKLYVDLNAKGTYDMYTPLILTRMAVEQYLKYLYELNRISPETPSSSECRQALLKNHLITRANSNELWAVLRRGNANTHEGYASYVFANMHCIAVLKMCLEELRRVN